MTYNCQNCSTPFEDRPSNKRKFCSQSCSVTVSNRKRKGFSHPNAKLDSVTGYRWRALEHYGAQCTVCGYGVKSVLQVHHRDGNRRNGAIGNLDVLCPTHHAEYQIGIRVYAAQANLVKAPV